MREHIKAEEPFEREDVPAEEALEAVPRRGPGLQGRADRGPDEGRRGDRLALPQRAVHRPLPRPARAHDQDGQGVQARVDRGRLLARRREPPDAHADLRHGVPVEGGARGAPRAARAGARPRPPQARQGARPLHVQRAVAGLAVLAAERAARLERADRAVADREPRHAATTRCTRRSSTTSSSGSSRATGTSTARTCTSPRSRSGRWA